MDFEGKCVVVTTNADRRGVFMGKLLSFDKSAEEAELAEAQMAVYYSPETHGVLGLAAKGPAAGSRISDPVPLIFLNGVTSVTLCTEDAVAKWKEVPWS